MKKQKIFLSFHPEKKKEKKNKIIFSTLSPRDDEDDDETKNNFISRPKQTREGLLLLLVCGCFPLPFLVYRLSNPL